MPRFPHYTKEEAEVMEAFLKAKVLEGARWQFDVKLPVELPEGIKKAPEPYRRMWEVLTAKRIDAVAEMHDFIHIIEVKKRLLPSGIGQLFTYKSLYQKLFKPRKPIKLWMIAKYDDPAVRNICEELGINTWVIEKL